MPGSKLFIPGSVGPPGPPGPAGPALTLSNQGTPLGTITTLDVEGPNASATIAGSVGSINVPPPPTPAFGYFSGGQTTGPVSTKVTNRLAFNTDSVAMTSVGQLVNLTSAAQAFNSSSKGYFAEGANNGAVDALVFATDGTAMTTVVNFTTNEGIPTSSNGANSSTLGYFVGYNKGAGAGSIDNLSLTFASDTSALVAKGQCTVDRQSCAATNSTTNAYFAGGTGTGGVAASCDKLVFASDASNMTSASVLPSAIQELAGANSASFGYYSGGNTSAGFTPVNTTSALNFASDSTAMVAKGVLTQTTSKLGGANSTLNAYFAGGSHTSDATFVSVCNRLSFAADSSALISVGALTQAQGSLGACQSGGIL